MGGLTWMTMDTWVNIVSNNSNRGKSIGIYNSSVTAGLALGPLIVGILGTSSRIPLIVCMILVGFKIISLISIKKFVNQVIIPEQSSKMKFSILAISPFVFFAIFCAGIEDSSFLALFPAFMINDFFNWCVLVLEIMADYTGMSYEYLNPDSAKSNSELPVSYTHLTLPTILLV